MYNYIIKITHLLFILTMVRKLPTLVLSADASQYVKNADVIIDEINEIDDSLAN